MTPGEPCASHPEAVASYRCDGCGERLCEACVSESHALLLCRLCGERAMPLAEGGAATVAERHESQRAAGSGSYGLGDALVYPFRGKGLYMFLAALVSAAFVTLIARYGIGCFALFIWLAWVSLLIGIQFKIVATTARWENEIPDWPEYFSFTDRLIEILTWLVIVVLQVAPVVVYGLLWGAGELLTAEPSAIFWLGFTASLWLGTALSVMAWGAAGVHWRHLCLRVDKHVGAFLSVGGDAVATTNVVFALVGAVFLLQGFLEARVPVAGGALAGTVGIYWTFLQPHLVGTLFRRHRKTLHRIYEG